MKRIFLGGTTGNDYRQRLASLLLECGVGHAQIFDPVVDHWSEEAQRREDAIKADPSVIMLFYLCANGDGSFLSFYSLHEATMGLYDEPNRTVIVFDYSAMLPRASKRLKKVARDLQKRFPSAPLFESLDVAATWLGQQLIPDR